MKIAVRWPHILETRGRACFCAGPMGMGLPLIGAVARTGGNHGKGACWFRCIFVVLPAAGHAAAVGIIGPRKNSPAPGRFAMVSWGPDLIEAVGSAR
jgi:hypothetical protein